MQTINFKLSKVIFGPWKQNAANESKRNKLCAITSTAIQMGIYSFAVHKISQAAFPFLLKQNPLNASNKIFLYRVVIAIPYAALLISLVNQRKEHSFCHKMALTSLVLQSLALAAFKMPILALTTISSCLATPLLFHQIKESTVHKVIPIHSPKEIHTVTMEALDTSVKEDHPVSTQKQDDPIDLPKLNDLETLTKEIKEDNYSKVKELLQKGTPIDKVSIDNQSAIHYAIKNKMNELLLVLLPFHPDLNVKNSSGETPLQYAAKIADPIIIQTLIIHGNLEFDVDDTFELEGKKINYLSVPIDSGNLEVVKKMTFLARGRLKALLYAMKMAASKNKPDIIRWIAKQEASTVEVQDENGDTPLHWAAYYEQTDNIKFLIDQGANTEATNKKGRAPLFHLVHHRKLDLPMHPEFSALKALLKKTNIHAVDSTNNTVLHRVVEKKDLILLYRFLEYKPDLNCKNNHGLTPLDLAKEWPEGKGLFKLFSKTFSKEDTDLKKLLIKAIITPDLYEIFTMIRSNNFPFNNLNNGCHAIHIAAKEGYPLTIKQCIQMNPNCLTLQDDEGNGVIHSLAQSNHSEEFLKDIVKIPRIDLKAVNKRKQTALHTCIDGPPKTLAFFLTLGFDLEAEDIDGNTPLLQAFLSNKTDAIDLLISKGVNFLHKNKKGDNILHIFARKATSSASLSSLPQSLLDEKNHEGFTPVQLAVIHGSISCLEESFSIKA